MSDLFRQEALNHSRRRLNGEVLLAVPLRSRVFGWLAIVVVIVAVLFASLATYARKETVQGWLAPVDGLIRVQARQSGVVSQIGGQNSETIRSGAVLITAVSSIETGRGSASDLIGAGIESEAVADARRLGAQIATLDSEADRVRVSLEISSRERTELQKRLQLQQTQLELARGVVEQSRSLADRGYLPKRELDARISAALNAEEYLLQLRSQMLGLERQSAEGLARLREIPREKEAVEAQATAASAQLGQRATDISSQGTFAVTAPVDGRIEEMTVRQGQTISAGDTIAIISPGGSRLEVELFIPARAIGFVQPGQDVRLLFDAFPYQKFGATRGRVISVSSTSLAPSELGDTIVPVTEAVYRARVRLDSNSIAAYGSDIPLRSGMTVTADIIVDRRSLLEWLLDPIYATGRRA